ncbi:AraC family transcriptional regulator [Rubritalea profundi]|uniref:HTH araC/xylS-type domain-containing protein n=1 Tax=Rubritalea profundi TaxID=1658618 RepID=A0A2S7U3I7_9BACT|nr:AraC family transcriptional regulator [Rubritalea profundi]PQJ28713.1 hypothetical protein BSZ32_09505 [Rubritalea profundi]
MDELDRRLYGKHEREGIGLSWYQSAGDFAPRLTEGSLHIVLNLRGSAILFSSDLRVNLSPNTMVIFHRGVGEDLTATRMQQDESYLILSVTTQWISKTFGARQEALHPMLRAILTNSESASTTLGKVRSLSLAEKEIAHGLISPPVPEAARDYWYLAKILELLTHHLFTPNDFQTTEPFCSKIKRADRVRTERCISWLRDRLDQAMNLNDLAKSVGCAPHYLSRQFKKSTGVTLKQKHRELRIDHAANLLLDGDFNVTEAALEVGYNSLSHFSKAFQEEKGQLPSEFLLG